jgi:hypothetical protein
MVNVFFLKHVFREGILFVSFLVTEYFAFVGVHFVFYHSVFSKRCGVFKFVFAEGTFKLGR